MRIRGRERRRRTEHAAAPKRNGCPGGEPDEAGLCRIRAYTTRGRRSGCLGGEDHHLEVDGAAGQLEDDDDDRATRKKGKQRDGDRREEVLGVEASVLPGARPWTWWYQPLGRISWTWSQAVMKNRSNEDVGARRP